MEDDDVGLEEALHDFVLVHELVLEDVVLLVEDVCGGLGLDEEDGARDEVGTAYPCSKA